MCGAVLTRRLTDAVTSGLVDLDLPAGVTADTLTQYPRAIGLLTEPLRRIATRTLEVGKYPG